ncbi:MAG: hypothetical protein RL173_108 [Fibrobacterota bacterium]
MVVFEHERIRVGQDVDGQELTQRQFDAIARWKERTNHPGLEIGHHSIRTSQWVGVLQVGRTTIEILPKADARRGQENLDRRQLVQHWKFVLLDMLAALKGFDLHASSRAQLHLQSHTLLDIFFSAYVEEAQSLLHEGLAKTYRHVAKNRTAWRGRFVVGENLRRNLTHQERVYTEAIEYDIHNVWNRILVIGLRLVAMRAESGLLRSRAKSLLLPYQEWVTGAVRSEDFERLRYDRRTERYRNAMDLAKLLLLRQNPDLCAGREDVFALLFDMNDLWEAWVAQEVRKSLKGKSWTLKTQSARHFWHAKGCRKTVRPDLVLEPRDDDALPLEHLLGIEPLKAITVLDTKWKVLSQVSPSDADLKQMYVYNKRWKAEHSWLVYPNVHNLSPTRGTFVDDGTHCGIAFVDLPKPKAVKRPT